MGYNVAVMPKKVEPSSDFGKRLFDLRRRRGFTQIQLAKAIGSTQRAISYYETVADFPPASVVIDLAVALQVTTDELLGVKKPKGPPPKKDPPEIRRLSKKFEQILSLPEKDRKAIFRMVNSLVAAKKAG